MKVGDLVKITFLDGIFVIVIDFRKLGYSVCNSDFAVEAITKRGNDGFGKHYVCEDEIYPLKVS